MLEMELVRTSENFVPEVVIILAFNEVIVAMPGRSISRIARAKITYRNKPNFRAFHAYCTTSNNNKYSRLGKVEIGEQVCHCSRKGLGQHSRFD
jgi:hypothetical protein